MLESWRSWARVERGLGERTITEYEREIRRLGPQAEGRTSAELRVLLYELGGAPSTVSRRIAAWHSFYLFLIRTEARDDDPTSRLDRPKVPKGLPRPVDDLPTRLLRLDPEFRAIAVFLSETGLRISEAAGLHVGLPVPEELWVRGKGKKDRVVPLSDLAREALTFLQGHVRWGPRTIQRRFREAGFTPHRLRHTLATELADNDVDVTVIQDLLGHESPATTRIYQRNSSKRLRAGLERRRAGRADPGA
jgi:integrase/recombinase XerD